MSVAFSSVLAHASPLAYTPAVYATIVGSNIGAFFTPLGALAGIMWMSILRQKGVMLSYSTFIRYGVLVGSVSLLVTLAVLGIVLSAA